LNSRFLDKDILGGLMLLAVALIGGLVSLRYPMGSSAMMGPGYVPRVLCGGLGFVSILILVGGLQRAYSEGSAEQRFKPELAPLAFVVGAMVVFGLVIDWLGLLLSILLLTAVANGAAPRYRVVETTVLALVLSLFTALVFVVGLGLPIPLWPEQLR
jgi:hypothetical protein